MNILVVTQSFFPDVDGGSGRFVFELSRRLRDRGHDVTLLGERAARGLEPATRLDGMRVFRYGSPILGLVSPWTFTSPLLVRHLAGSLHRRHRFDLVWCHHYSPGLGGLLFAREKGLPALFTYHASRYIEWRDRAGRPRRFNSSACRLLFRWWADAVYASAALGIERKCLRMSNLITVLSDFSRRQLEDTHPREAGKVMIIPGGVDTERFRPVADVKSARRRLGLPEDGLLILTVRRLIARMGLENLVDAMKIVLEIEPEAHLLICGRGYLLESLRKRAADAGLAKRVRLLGYVDDGLLPRYYAASDLFVLPTLALEGFGMVTLEALSCGTPVLGTNAGATPEILDGLDRDLILRRTDPGCIADAVLRHKERYHAPEMRAKCRRYVEQRYSWGAVTDRVEKTIIGLAEHARA